MKTKPDAETINRWREMTDANDHNDVRIDIARWILKNTRIVVSDLLETYKLIRAYQEARGCLTPMLYYARIGVDTVMIDRARREDAELSKTIYNCL